VFPVCANEAEVIVHGVSTTSQWSCPHLPPVLSHHTQQMLAEAQRSPKAADHMRYGLRLRLLSFRRVFLGRRPSETFANDSAGCDVS